MNRAIAGVSSKSHRAAAAGIAEWLCLALLLVPFASLWANGESAPEQALPPHALVLDVKDAIGPAVLDYISRSMEKADELDSSILIIKLDTPGGLITTTREIISLILDSPKPVILFVAPQGARAASAGTFLVYASHVAAMSPATHLGAATPVQLGGGSSPFNPSPQEKGEEGENEEAKKEDPSAMERKAINDTVAYIRSLAELRGRNADWAEKAVREGASLTSDRALEENVIDVIAPNLDELLETIDGRTVTVREQEMTLTTSNLEIRSLDPDWRTRLLSILTNPNVAYILVMLGIYGLIFEFANPGSLVPGVAGAIMLLIGLFALQLLPINYAGLALLILGIGLMVAEAFAPSFGIMGIGGIIAFAIGSIMLIDTDVPAFEIGWPIVAVFSAFSALVFVLVLAMALKAWKRPVVSGHESIIGELAKASEGFEKEGWVRLRGESWKARSSEPIQKGQSVKVTRAENLLLDIEPATPRENENEKRKDHE